MMPSGVASTTDAELDAAPSSVGRNGVAELAAMDSGRVDSSPPPEPSSFCLRCLKEEAKRAYELGEYEQALACYLRALERDDVESNPTEHSLLLSNAAACRLQMHHIFMHYLHWSTSLGGADRSDDPGPNSESNAQRSRDVLVEAAVADARRCTQLNPNWPGGHLRLAQAMIALNRRDASNAACNSLQTALELNPGLYMARQMLLRELRRRDVPPRGHSSNGDHDPHSRSERRGRAVIPLKRYELDDSAVVTLGDRAALSCRRAKQYVRRNWFGWYLLYLLFYFAGSLCEMVESGLQDFKELCAVSQQEMRAHIEFFLLRKDYPKQYQAFQCSHAHNPDSTPSPFPLKGADDSSCVASTPSASVPWSWIMDDAESSIRTHDQCPRMHGTPRHE